MRTVVYTDGEGCRFKVSLPDDVPDAQASLGIVVGPPDLSSLALPTAVKVRLHNELYARGLLTARDIKGRHKEVFAALQAAFSIDVQHIQAIYNKEADIV